LHPALIRKALVLRSYVFFVDAEKPRRQGSAKRAAEPLEMMKHPADTSDIREAQQGMGLAKRGTIQELIPPLRVRRANER